jgi:hypothetical protein
MRSCAWRPHPNVRPPAPALEMEDPVRYNIGLSITQARPKEAWRHARLSGAESQTPVFREVIRERRHVSARWCRIHQSDRDEQFGPSGLWYKVIFAAVTVTQAQTWPLRTESTVVSQPKLHVFLQGYLRSGVQ